jgi:hypothetical protein
MRSFSTPDASGGAGVRTCTRRLSFPKSDEQERRARQSSERVSRRSLGSGGWHGPASALLGLSGRAPQLDLTGPPGFARRAPAKTAPPVTRAGSGVWRKRPGSSSSARRTAVRAEHDAVGKHFS